ncbi:MAG: histidine phosphatase family protein, partial [Chloroflexota bacterium]
GEPNIVAIYSSPLGRALDTARPTAERLGLAVQPLPAIGDIDFGDWQGLTPDEVAARYPDLYRRWLLAPHTVQFPGGESLAMVQARAFGALNELANLHDGSAFVVVTHKVPCRVLISAALGLDNAHYWQIEQDNAAINVIDFADGLFVIERLNDVSHLGGV